MRNNFSMNESIREDIPQVTPTENDLLTAEFSENEVWEAVFQMKHNKAPGPDGFPTEFYQVFWSLIKNDLMPLFRDFHVGRLPLFNLNFGIICFQKNKRPAKSNNTDPFACLMLASRSLLRCWLIDYRR
jgi:hypothetical protein